MTEATIAVRSAARAGRSGCGCDELPYLMPMTSNDAACLCPQCLKAKLAPRNRWRAACSSRKMRAFGPQAAHRRETKWA
jgi:hypothetical protein